MSDEVELKLELPSGTHGALANDPLLQAGAGRTVAQRTIYFDTRKGALGSAGYSLRLRHVDGRTIQTLKRSRGQGLFSRHEWEWDVSGDEPVVDRLAEVPLELDGGWEKVARKLRPVLRSEVERTSWVVQEGASRVQVDLDAGMLKTDKATVPLEEVEFELIEGDPADAVAAARAVAERLPARLGVLSKAERGAALLGGRLGKAVKASPLQLGREMTVAQAFAAIVHACLRHFRQNEDLVLACQAADALHQSRVAMRRLRSALTFFRPAIRDDPAFARLREELRWFTAELGDARDLDVYLQRDLPEAEREAALARRGQAYARVLEAMNAARSRLLMIDLTGWIETGDWRRGKVAERPIPSFAGKRLDRLWATIEPTGRSLSAMSDTARHELRIQIKKLRYAIEFFDALTPRSRQKKAFSQAVEALQESLGKLNDLATARTLVPDAERVAEQEQTEEAEHLHEAEAALRRLGKAGPFWRGE